METADQKIKTPFFKGDITIVIIAIFLSAFSIYAVYSSTGIWKEHLFMLLLSFSAMFIFYKIDYRFLSALAPMGLFTALALLVYTIGWGDESSRGIVIFGRGVQTFFFIGFLVVFYLAKVLAVRISRGEALSKNDVIHLFVVVGLSCGMMAASNMSTAVILFITAFVLLFMGNMKTKHILFLLGLGICGGMLFMATGIGRGSTFKNRLNYYITQDNSRGYGNQMIQAKAAIARSGFLPQGPGNGVIKKRLPESDTDYIYSTIFEELGLLIGIAIIILYIILFYRAWKIARRSDGPFGMLMAMGIGLWFTAQALIHIGVNCELLPATGQTLPFISRGGTSMVFSGMAIGILLNIGKTAKIQEKP